MQPKPPLVRQAGLDVVIPVWNEAAWLERLLCRCRSSGLVGNIIVADNASSDASAAIARRHGCAVVHGGRPAQARNSGGHAARAPVILFVDADTIVPDSSLRAALRELENDAVVAVHFRTIPLTANRWIRGLYTIMRMWIGGLDRLGISQGIGTAIVVRATAFHRIGGFREDVAVGEDTMFLRDIAVLGRVVYLRRHAVFTSARRLYAEGMLAFPLKVAMWALLRLCNTTASLISYRWESYSATLAHREDRHIVGLGL
jgi:glycosyltransferase involved in cell wall biosynthesis